jgi:hypothetical protein
MVEYTPHISPNLSTRSTLYFFQYKTNKPTEMSAAPPIETGNCNESETTMTDESPSIGCPDGKIPFTRDEALICLHNWVQEGLITVQDIIKNFPTVKKRTKTQDKKAYYKEWYNQNKDKVTTRMQIYRRLKPEVQLPQLPQSPHPPQQ